MPDIEILHVSEHAILRYIERNKRVITEIEQTIIDQLMNGVEVKPRYPEAKKSQEPGKPIRYIKCRKLVFVISHDGVVITTLNYDYKSFVKIKY